MLLIGSDHGGYNLKEEIKKYLTEIGVEFEDVGTNSTERTDYPIFAKEVASAISIGKSEKGILICSSGCGMTIAANKFKGVRACLMINDYEAELAKGDNDINCLVLSARNTDINEAVKIIRTWIATEFKGGRYKERLDMIAEIEKENMK